MESTNTTCPYLGLISDPQTRYTGPDGHHVCHQALPPQYLTLDQQRVCCLTPNYPACPGVCQGWNGPLPAELSAPAPQRKPVRQLRAAALIGLAILTLGMLAILLIGAAAQKPVPVATLPGGLNPRTMTPTLTLTVPPTPTFTITPRPTVYPSVTSTQLPPTPGPALETPFGTDVTCLIHQVAEGEALEYLAAKYRTSMQVVRAVNDLPTATLWVGSFLVLCPDRMDADGLPRLTPRYIKERTRLADLAAETGVDPDVLRAWNSLGTAEWIEAERWVVIP